MCILNILILLLNSPVWVKVNIKKYYLFCNFSSPNDSLKSFVTNRGKNDKCKLFTCWIEAPRPGTPQDHLGPDSKETDWNDLSPSGPQDPSREHFLTKRIFSLSGCCCCCCTRTLSPSCWQHWSSTQSCSAQFPCEHWRKRRPRIKSWPGCDADLTSPDSKLELLMKRCEELSHWCCCCCCSCEDVVFNLWAEQQWLLSVPLSNPLWTSISFWARRRTSAGAPSSSSCDVTSATQQQHCGRAHEHTSSSWIKVAHLDSGEVHGSPKKLLFVGWFPPLLLMMFSRK
jgi:hypothetical protein